MLLHQSLKASQASLKLANGCLVHDSAPPRVMIAPVNEIHPMILHRMKLIALCRESIPIYMTISCMGNSAFNAVDLSVHEPINSVICSQFGVANAVSMSLKTWIAAWRAMLLICAKKIML